jgi:hypothetical protein
MILRLLLGLCVLTLTAASAYNNYQHMQHLGYGVLALVIGAELAKPLLPIALIAHARNEAIGQWLGTLCIWLVIVVFSFVNTFGNSVARLAIEKARQDKNVAGETRPEFVILRELANITCKKKEQEKCQSKRNALNAELNMAKKTGETTSVEAAISGDVTTNGYIQLAALGGFQVSEEQVNVWTVLLWTLLAELGSALGGLCIPQRKKNA